MKTDAKTGIVLSGGGAHGIAHAGVLKALNEANIYPDIIAAVSAGAMVGVLYAQGISPDDILSIFIREKMFKYPGLKLRNKGLLNGEKVIERLLAECDVKNFSDLKIPLIITTSNFNTGEQGVFITGEIFKPLCATISIPILFSGVMIEGDVHYDGGLIDNLPVDILYNRCEKLIAVNVNPITRVEKFETLQELILRIAHIGTTAKIEDRAGKCDLLIEPVEVLHYPMFSNSKLKETFDAGYRHTKELLSNPENLKKFVL